MSVDSVLSVHGYMSRTVVDYDSNRNPTHTLSHSINSVELHESERRKLIPHCYEWRVREWIGREEVPEWCIRLYYVASEPLGST